MGHPCSVNPEMWFGYADDDSGDGAAKARAYEQSATEARLQCLRRCPLAQQRLCAKYAVENREEYGVWAGVKLPGGQYRKREQLAEAHATLRRIAAGEISSRQLADNAALLRSWPAIGCSIALVSRLYPAMANTNALKWFAKVYL